MRFVVQRVCEASVSVEDQVIGQIGHGLLVFVGVADSDDQQIADKMIDKLTKLRILMMQMERRICRLRMWAVNF